VDGDAARVVVRAAALDRAVLGPFGPERNPWLLADRGMSGVALLYYARPGDMMTMLFLARLAPVLFGLLGAVYIFPAPARC
jgi:hypothetical protein